MGKKRAVLSSSEEWLAFSLKKRWESRSGIDEGALLPEEEGLYLLLRNARRQGVITYMLEPTAYTNSTGGLEISRWSMVPLQGITHLKVGLSGTDILCWIYHLY